jgi:hypothetical protein
MTLMPIAEITRAESAERARLLRDVTYEVAVDLDRGDRVFGSASIVSGHLRVTLVHLLFPYPAVTAGLVAQIDEVLAAGSVDPGLGRMLAEFRDIARRALRSRSLVGDGLELPDKP